MSGTRRKLAALALAGVWLLAVVGGASAASSGAQFRLPVTVVPGPTPPNKSGLTIAIDTRWVPVNGYRPVNIQITPLAPITSDRTLQIRMRPFGGWSGPSLEIGAQC